MTEIAGSVHRHRWKLATQGMASEGACACGERRFFTGGETSDWNGRDNADVAVLRAEYRAMGIDTRMGAE